MTRSAMWGKIRDFAAVPYQQWISRVWLDPLIVVGLVGAHAYAVSRGWVPSLLEGVEVSTRPSLYAAAAIVLSLTGTLGSVSVAQYLQARGDRARELKRQHPGALATSWKVIFSTTIIGSVLFLSAFRLDSEYSAPYAPPQLGSSAGAWVFEVGALLALVSLARLVALFGELVDLIVLDDTDPLTNAFEINPAMFEESEKKTHV